MECSSLKEVTIPDTLLSIGMLTFAYCPNLSNIVIPQSITAIGPYAFCGCESLRSISIPQGVKSIGDQAFAGCTSLENIIIPPSVVALGDDIADFRNLETIGVVEGSPAHQYLLKNFGSLRRFSASLSYLPPWLYQ